MTALVKEAVEDYLNKHEQTKGDIANGNNRQNRTIDIY